MIQPAPIKSTGYIASHIEEQLNNTYAKLQSLSLLLVDTKTLSTMIVTFVQKKSQMLLCDHSLQVVRAVTAWYMIPPPASNDTAFTFLL